MILSLNAALVKMVLQSSKKRVINQLQKVNLELGHFIIDQTGVRKPISKIKRKIIQKNLGWCNDPKNKNYNKEIKVSKKIKYEKIYRNDYKYNYFIVIEYNIKKIIPNKGSAIFLHLTKDYKPTAGCIAISEKDFLILLKIVNKKTKININ